MTPADSPVEIRLDELLVALTGHPRHIRHQLAEAEDHLREATVEGMAQGLTPEDAERQAVDRFGPVRPLAQAESRRQHRSVGDVAAGSLVSAWWLGALAAVAVGLSGLLAALGTALWGQTFTAGRPPPSVLTGSNCARWTAHTRMTCLPAATADWAHDIALSRTALGVIGGAALAVWVLWRRRQRRLRVAGRPALGLPAAVVDTIAVTCFGGAGVWLTGQTVDTFIVAGGRGAGQWLSAVPVAVGLGVAFGLRLLRDLRAGGAAPPPWPLAQTVAPS